MSHKPGGGLHSKVVKHTSNPKSEPRANAKNPGGVSQFGQAQGNHITRAGQSNYRGDPVDIGRGYQNPVGPTSMALSGPGSGRKIYGSGSQQQYGSGGTATSAGREILSSFGPESSRPHNPGNNPGRSRGALRSDWED
jgi:hypothetical protein